MLPALSGCSALDGLFGKSTPAPMERLALQSDYLGSIVADDPQAVDIARRILSDGGAAADAATGLALTLSVTLPSRAGLDGGGVCLVRDAKTGQVDALDFVPTDVAGTAPVPHLVRAMAAIQARYGKLRWAQTVGPVEKLASLGIVVTGQLLADLAAAGIAAVGPGGQPLKVGDILPQRAVAETLGLLRTNGPNDLYTGQLAGQLVTSGMDGQQLAQYAPRWATPLDRPIGTEKLFFAPGYGGSLAVNAWDNLVKTKSDKPANDDARFALARQAIAGALAGPLDVARATTGFIVTDKDGGAVSCAIGMGKLFGTGAILEPLGIYAATPFDAETQAALAPLLSGSGRSNQFSGAVVGAGSTAAPADAATAAYIGLVDNRSIAIATAAPRSRGELDGAGLAAARVHGVVCGSGLPLHPETCLAARDSRGTGFSLNADKLAR